MTLDENCSEAAQAAKKEKEKKKGKKKKSRIFLELRFANKHRNCQLWGKAVTILHTRINLAPVSQLINPQEIGNNPVRAKMQELSAKEGRPNCQKIRIFKVSEKNYPKPVVCRIIHNLCTTLAASSAYMLI